MTDVATTKRRKYGGRQRRVVSAEEARRRTITVTIRPDLREALEAEAARREESLSSVLGLWSDLGWRLDTGAIRGPLTEPERDELEMLRARYRDEEEAAFARTQHHD
jgi:hypothetical protein